MNISQPSICSMCEEDESLLKTKVSQSSDPYRKDSQRSGPRKSPNAWFSFLSIRNSVKIAGGFSVSAACGTSCRCPPPSSQRWCVTAASLSCSSNTPQRQHERRDGLNRRKGKQALMCKLALQQCTLHFTALDVDLKEGRAWLH